MLAGTAYKPSRINPTLRLMRRYWIFYLLYLPIAVYYVLFHYIPLTGIVMAFKDYQFNLGIMGSPWASEHGFHHFIRFLTNGEFQRVFSNTLILSFMQILLGFPAPIIMALLLNEMRGIRYKRILQTISYLPHFVSFVVVYAILYNFFSLNGFVNAIRVQLGLERLLFLGNKSLYKWLYTLSNIWKGVGWGSIIYLAALSRVNMELYEAADIDGASRWKKMWHITLPGIRPLISLQFVMTMGGLFRVGMTQTLVMINDMVAPVAETVGYFVYRTGLLTINQYSYASAIGLFNSVLGFIMVVLTNTVAKKIDEDGGVW